MKNKNVGYLLKEGFKGIFLHGFMSFAAICVTVSCLLLIGFFYLLSLNVNQIVSDLDQENQVIAYVDESLSEASAKSIGTEINKIKNVAKSEFVSNEEALENFIAEQDDPDAFSGLTASFFRHRFVITLESSEDMASTVRKIEGISGIADVSAKEEIADGFYTVRRVISIISTALIVILLIVSLFIISNTVKLAMADRRDEIAIMKMVGATNGFIQVPFIIEGFVIGIISGVIAFFSEWGIYNILCNRISEIQTTISLIHTISFIEVLPIMVATFLAASLIVGIAGSLLSIRRFLDV